MSLTAGHSSTISISKIVSILASKHRGRPKESPYDHGGFEGKEAVGYYLYYLCALASSLKQK